MRASQSWKLFTKKNTCETFWSLLSAAVVTSSGSQVQGKSTVQAPAGPPPMLSGYVVSAKSQMSGGVDGAVSSPASAMSLSFRSANACTFGPVSAVVEATHSGGMLTRSRVPPSAAPG